MSMMHGTHCTVLHCEQELTGWSKAVGTGGLTDTLAQAQIRIVLQWRWQQ